MTEFRYPLTAGAKNAEQGRDIKVDALQWVSVTALPDDAEDGQVCVLSTDGLAYQWWSGAWRLFAGGGAPSGLTAADIAYTNPLHPTFTTVKDALDAIFYVPLSLTSFSNNVGTREVGQVVTDVTFNWSYNKSVTSQSVLPGYPSVAPALRTLTNSGLNITSDTSWTLSGTDGTNTVGSSTSISFRNRRHWGASSQLVPDDALINALAGSELATSRNQTKTFSPAGGYIYFAWPVSFGTSPTFTINSFPVSGWLSTTVSHTNAYGYVSNYVVFRSQYPQSGINIPVVVT